MNNTSSDTPAARVEGRITGMYADLAAESARRLAANSIDATIARDGVWINPNTPAEPVAVGKCQHCGVAQFNNPNADPALDGMADLCWKCVRPHGIPALDAIAKAARA